MGFWTEELRNILSIWAVALFFAAILGVVIALDANIWIIVCAALTFLCFLFGAIMVTKGGGK